MTRENRSRAPSSVPSQCLPDGGVLTSCLVVVPDDCCRQAIVSALSPVQSEGFAEAEIATENLVSGLYGEISGAKRAQNDKRITTTTPNTASGLCRKKLRNPLKRREDDSISDAGRVPKVPAGAV